jgi:hypothetical protein
MTRAGIRTDYYLCFVVLICVESAPNLRKSAMLNSSYRDPRVGRH